MWCTRPSTWLRICSAWPRGSLVRHNPASIPAKIFRVLRTGSPKWPGPRRRGGPPPRQSAAVCPARSPPRAGRRRPGPGRPDPAGWRGTCRAYVLGSALLSFIRKTAMSQFLVRRSSRATEPAHASCICVKVIFHCLSSVYPRLDLFAGCMSDFFVHIGFKIVCNRSVFICTFYSSYV